MKYIIAGIRINDYKVYVYVNEKYTNRKLWVPYGYDVKNYIFNEFDRKEAGHNFLNYLEKVRDFRYEVTTVEDLQLDIAERKLREIG